ncbi:MAG: rhodanese-like domain-containing protein [Proteobacteria bacterium]|nr:rhodanese-like domain-containing protein [Pseudomonadota bacterium]
MGIRELAEQAQGEIKSMTVTEILPRYGDDDLVFVDVRDIREVEKSGTIKGAQHAPRGMIEFWFDPESPYHRDVYGDAGKTYVLFCNAEWRSALCAKSLQDMGIRNVAQLFGGLPAWRDAGGPTEEKLRR